MGAITDFIDANPQIALGGAVVGVLVIGGILLKKRSAQSALAATTPTGVTSDLSGLTSDGQGGHIVYVPTQTTFSTDNRTIGADFSNDPQLTTIQTGQIGPIGNTDTTTTNTKTTSATPVATIPTPTTPRPIVPPSPPASSGSAGTGNPPPRATTPPTVAPPTQGKNLYWDQRYTISGGETLSSIAAMRTRWLRANKGFPGSMSITWNDLYAHNTTVINAESAAHNNPIPGGPWNDIFPGEVIVLPDWR